MLNTLSAIIIFILRKLLISTVLVLITLQQSSAQVLVKIGDKKLSVDEFLWGYHKNNRHPYYTGSDLENYLNQYINYRLKALEARSLKMDEDSSCISELIVYKNAMSPQTGADAVYLMNEYKNGILLFNISDKKLWQYAKADLSGLVEFYQKSSSIYTGSLEQNKSAGLLDYQQFLDEKWVTDLHKKYPVHVISKELKKMVK